MLWPVCVKRAVIVISPSASSSSSGHQGRAVTKVATSVSEAVTKALEVVKAQLKELAEAAAASASAGLEALKTKLAPFPKKVSDFLTELLCGKLPTSPDLQKPCKDGMPDLVKTVTSKMAEMCTEGVKKMTDGAKTACSSGATKTEEVITKGGASCVTMANALPTQLSKPIADACNKAATGVASVPKEVCTTALSAMEKAADSTCSAISTKTQRTEQILANAKSPTQSTLGTRRCLCFEMCSDMYLDMCIDIRMAACAAAERSWPWRLSSSRRWPTSSLR